MFRKEGSMNLERVGGFAALARRWKRGDITDEEFRYLVTKYESELNQSTQKPRPERLRAKRELTKS